MLETFINMMQLNFNRTLFAINSLVSTRSLHRKPVAITMQSNEYLSVLRKALANRYENVKTIQLQPAYWVIYFCTKLYI